MKILRRLSICAMALLAMPAVLHAVETRMELQFPGPGYGIGYGTGWEREYYTLLKDREFYGYGIGGFEFHPLSEELELFAEGRAAQVLFGDRFHRTYHMAVGPFARAGLFPLSDSQTTDWRFRTGLFAQWYADDLELFPFRFIHGRGIWYGSYLTHTASDETSLLHGWEAKVDLRIPLLHPSWYLAAEASVHGAVPIGTGSLPAQSVPMIAVPGLGDPVSSQHLVHMRAEAGARLPNWEWYFPQTLDLGVFGSFTLHGEDPVITAGISGVHSVHFPFSPVYMRIRGGIGTEVGKIAPHAFVEVLQILSPRR